VLEVGMEFQLDKSSVAGSVVARGVEREPVPCARSDVALGPELWAGPGEGEVDVE